MCDTDPARQRVVSRLRRRIDAIRHAVVEGQSVIADLFGSVYPRNILDNL